MNQWGHSVEQIIAKPHIVSSTQTYSRTQRNGPVLTQSTIPENPRLKVRLQRANKSSVFSE